MRKLALALACLLPALPAVAGQPLRVGVCHNPPLSFTDERGRARGICVDLLEHVAAREGWRLRFAAGTRAEILARAERGELDLIAGLEHSPAAAARLDFGLLPVFQDWSRIYARPDSGVETVANLNGRSVAVAAEDPGAADFDALLGQFRVECRIVRVRDWAAVLEAVGSGRAEAGLVGRAYGRYRERESGLARALIMCRPREVRFAAPRGRSAEVLAALDRHLEAMVRESDSPFDRSVAKWLGGAPLLPAWLYVTLCVAVPPAWGLLSFWIFELLLRRRARRPAA